MANDLNQCQFIGRVGQDPEIRFTQSGDAVANLSLAVGKKYKNDGQVVEETEWVRLVAFKRLADVIKDYVKKGSRLYVSGEMKTRKWQDQSGQDRYSTEVVIRDMQMLDLKKDQSTNTQNEQDYRGHTESNQKNPTYQQGHPQPSPMANNPQGYANQQSHCYQAPQDDFDDDAPF